MDKFYQHAPVGISPAVGSSEFGGRVRKAAEILQATHSSNLDGIAEQLNISSSRLRHILTVFLGQSPARYVKSLKLQQAQELFRTSFLSVKQVMVEVGLHDISHFVRDYKIAFGETPSETRRQSEKLLQ